MGGTGRGSTLSEQGPFDIFEKQHEVEVVGGALLEFRYQMPIEASRSIGLGMHEQTPAADLVVDRGHADKHIPQQAGTKALPLVIPVYAESCEQRDRLRVATSALGQSLWSGSGVDLGHRPRIVRNHCAAISRGYDEYLRCARCHRLPSVAAQPLGLFDRAADELFQVVMAIEGLRGLVTHSTNGEGRSINLPTPGSSRAGRALIDSHSVSAWADSTNLS